MRRIKPIIAGFISVFISVCFLHAQQPSPQQQVQIQQIEMRAGEQAKKIQLQIEQQIQQMQLQVQMQVEQLKQQMQQQLEPLQLNVRALMDQDNQKNKKSRQEEIRQQVQLLQQ